MNNLRAYFLGVFSAFYCVLPIISKTYDIYFFSNQRQEMSFQEKNSISVFSGKELSAHHVLKLCNIVGLLSAVLFIILTAIVRLRMRHQVREVSDCSNLQKKVCHEKEPFLLRAATVWILAILITAAIIISICVSFLG